MSVCTKKRPGCPDINTVSLGLFRKNRPLKDRRASLWRLASVKSYLSQIMCTQPSNYVEITTVMYFWFTQLMAYLRQRHIIVRNYLNINGNYHCLICMYFDAWFQWLTSSQRLAEHLNFFSLYYGICRSMVCALLSVLSQHPFPTDCCWGCKAVRTLLCLSHVSPLSAILHKNPCTPAFHCSQGL